MPAGSRVPSTQPTGAAESDWSRPDLSLVLGSLAGLAVVGVLLARDVASGRPATASAASVGRVEAVLGQVLRRSEGTLAWHQTLAGDPVVVRDSLYVPPGAFAALALADGSRLDLGERTLVVLEPPTEEGLALRLVKGSLTGFAAGPLALRGGRSDARLEPGAAARIEAAEGAEPRVAVLAGRALVEGAPVEAAPGSVRLESPENHQRLYLAGFPARVTLRWDPANPSLRVEASGADGAAVPSPVEPARAGEAELPVPAPGAYGWRLLDGNGAPRSETRRFFALADEPPRHVTPRAGEIVLAPEGAQVPFWWTAAPGARRYRLEVALDPGFAKVAFSVESETPGAWVTPPPPEGVYLWRVRVSQPGREGAPWSEATSFRLIRRPLPEAPRLLDPSIEVDGGAAR
jgi:hypothetical protein